MVIPEYQIWNDGLDTRKRIYIYSTGPESHLLAFEHPTQIHQTFALRRITPYTLQTHTQTQKRKKCARQICGQEHIYRKIRILSHSSKLNKTIVKYDVFLVRCDQFWASIYWWEMFLNFAVHLYCVINVRDECEYQKESGHYTALIDDH